MKIFKKTNVILGIISFFIFTIAAIYISWPLIFHMTDFVNGELVIAWIMNWNIHAITHFTWPFFDANIFYPYHNTLAYSDLFLTSSFFTLPFFLLFHEPMLPANIMFFSSLIFVGFFTYILTFYITRNFIVSLLSGLLIIFSPVFLDKRYHLQIMALELIPLSLTFFVHFLKKGKYRFLLFSLCCLVLQSYNNFVAGYFIIFSYIGVSLFYLLYERNVLLQRATKKTIIFFIFSLLVVIPIAIPYYQVSTEFHFVRDIRETIHLALQPEDLFVTNAYSRMKPFLWFFDGTQYPPTAEIKPGFLGLTFSLLTIISIIYFFIHLRQKKKNLLFLAFISTGMFGLILSFGPALHLGRVTIHHPFLIPLPYAAAYYLFPGFKGIRDSSDFEMLFVLLMAVVIGIVLHEVLKRKTKVIKIIVYVILVIGVVGEYKGFIQYDKAYTFENFPPVYSWIKKNTPQNAFILEMPIYNWDNNPFGDNREVLREYFSTLHFRKLISGGSGFSPPPWQQFAKEEFANFPSPESIKNIKTYRVNYIIIHTTEFDILHTLQYKAGNHIVFPSHYVIFTLSQNKALRFIIKEGDDYVYQVK